MFGFSLCRAMSRVFLLLRRGLPWRASAVLLMPSAAIAAEGAFRKDATRDMEAVKEGARESMPLKIANRKIISLRGPIAGYSAQERVENSRQRIEEILA